MEPSVGGGRFTVFGALSIQRLEGSRSGGGDYGISIGVRDEVVWMFALGNLQMTAERGLRVGICRESGLIGTDPVMRKGCSRLRQDTGKVIGQLSCRCWTEWDV